MMEEQRERRSDEAPGDGEDPGFVARHSDAGDPPDHRSDESTPEDEKGGEGLWMH